MPKKLTEEVIQQIVHMYATKNQSGNAVADKLGLSRSCVYKVLRQNGYRSKVRRGPARKYNLTPEQEGRMVVMYEAGDSCEMIAEAFNMSWSAVSKRLTDQGVQLRPGGFQKGPDHHAWVGGRFVRDGYVYILISEDNPLYCMGQKKVGKVRYALEHRIVMACSLGRPLERHETVHHIDGDKSNNHIDNLQLRHGKHGKGAAFVCADCGSHNMESVPLSH